MRFMNYILFLVVIISSHAFCSQALGQSMMMQLDCVPALTQKPEQVQKLIDHSKELAYAVVNADIKTLKSFNDRYPDFFFIGKPLMYNLAQFPYSLKADLLRQGLKSVEGRRIEAILNKVPKKEFFAHLSTLKPYGLVEDSIDEFFERAFSILAEEENTQITVTFIDNVLLGNIDSKSYSDAIFTITLLELAVGLHGANSEVVNYLISTKGSKSYKEDGFYPQFFDEQERLLLLKTAIRQKNEKLIYDLIVFDEGILNRAFGEVIDKEVLLFLYNIASKQNNEQFTQALMDYFPFDETEVNLKEAVDTKDLEKLEFIFQYSKISRDELFYIFRSKDPEIIELLLLYSKINPSLLVLAKDIQIMTQHWDRYLEGRRYEDDFERRKFFTGFHRNYTYTDWLGEVWKDKRK